MLSITLIFPPLYCRSRSTRVLDFVLIAKPQRAIAAMSLEDIHMSTKDLLEQKQLDAGGFGVISLCIHKKHGYVVLKKVYTGPQRTE